MKMSHALNAQAAQAAQAGFTLLEVLIAVVVLSFGILGMVGLQAASLQANRDARLQSAAARLGREVADMMRGNKNVAIQTAAASNPYLFDSASGDYPAPPENCFLIACTTTLNVARYEMNEWVGRVVGTAAAPGIAAAPGELPGGRVVVCFDSDPFTASGTPKWACDGIGGVAVVKIGWTRLTTNRAAVAASAIDVATVPTIVLPVTAGS